MNFAEVVNLLASPHKIQVRYLQTVPENATSPDFTRDNNVYRMLLLYSRSCSVLDDEGSEGCDSWLQRTQFPQTLIDNRHHAVWTANGLLSTAIDMIEQLDRDFLYTAHGLRSAHEWKLVRHLATEVLDASDWPRSLAFSDFSQLWDALGGGVIECRI